MRFFIDLQEKIILDGWWLLRVAENKQLPLVWLLSKVLFQPFFPLLQAMAQHNLTVSNSVTKKSSRVFIFSRVRRANDKIETFLLSGYRNICLAQNVSHHRLCDSTPTSAFSRASGMEMESSALPLSISSKRLWGGGKLIFPPDPKWVPSKKIQSWVNYFSGDSSKQWIDHNTRTPWNGFLFSKSLIQLFGNLMNWNKRSSSDHELWGEAVDSAILLYWPLDHSLSFYSFSL